jgi:MYXO-CTERM domain-containing protein
MACGGCFSPPGQQNTQLILQNAERVLFHRDAKTKKTRVWVEVRFTGLAEDFGWVLPLPKKPQVSVGTSWVFDQLDARHAPRFSTTLDQGDENCRSWTSYCYGDEQSRANAAAPSAGGGFRGDSAAGSASEASDEDGKVQVLEKDQAGPYDYEILASKDSQALLDWLNDHGYDTPQKALPIIESHLAKGDVFVAVKLQNNAGVNEIKPIVLEMDDADACVPLRLTSIAASEDMSVIVTLAGPGRAVPKNHMHVEVNPLKLNWFQNGNNYAQVLSAAIDEAAGRAFATEYAGPGKQTALVAESQRMDVTPISYVTDAAGLAKALVDSRLILSADAVGILEKHTGLAKLAGLDPQSYFGQLQSCGYSSNLQPGSWCTKQLAAPSTLPVDGPALAAALDKEYVQPIHTIADAMIASETVTRLVMRISPEEMDRDPIFAFNPDLGDVSNEYTASFKRVCSTGWYPYDQTRITLAGGGSWVIDGTVPGDFNATGEIGNNAIDPRFKDAPMALRVELIDESGPAVQVHESQIELVDSAIAGAIVGGGPSLPKTVALQPVSERWKLPESDGKRSFVEQRDDSMCTRKHVVKPWTVAGNTGSGGAGSNAAPADAGGGCTASPHGHGDAGLLAGLLALLAIAFRRRRDAEA